MYRYTWAEQGSKNVNVSVQDDKRQYTGNIVHTADGQAPLFQFIVQGKTQNNVPVDEIKAQGMSDVFVAGATSNHWSNFEEKKRLINAMAAWVKQEAASLIKETKGMFMTKNPVWVCILDCWPMNLSERFREWLKQSHPQCRLRFIPAGMTGQKQINDVYLHAPYKKWVRDEAEAW